MSGMYFVIIKNTRARFESSVILFINFFFIKVISEKSDTHAHVDENIAKIAFVNVFKQSKVSGIAIHVVRMSCSGL